MIKIRYRGANELSPGLHAAAERQGRTTTVYLLSRLTPAERRAALRRLRLSARMGYCPKLPVAQLALALLADRVRTGFGQAGAVFRLHPAGSTLPVMLLSGGVIAFLLLSTVSIHVLREPRGSSPQLDPSAAPVASADAVPISGPAGQGGTGSGTSGSSGGRTSGSTGGANTNVNANVGSVAKASVSTSVGSSANVNANVGSVASAAVNASPGSGLNASVNVGSGANSPSSSSSAQSSSGQTPLVSASVGSSGACVGVSKLGVCASL